MNTARSQTRLLVTRPPIAASIQVTSYHSLPVLVAKKPSSKPAATQCHKTGYRRSLSLDFSRILKNPTAYRWSTIPWARIVEVRTISRTNRSSHCYLASHATPLPTIDVDLPTVRYRVRDTAPTNCYRGRPGEVAAIDAEAYIPRSAETLRCRVDRAYGRRTFIGVGKAIGIPNS